MNRLLTILLALLIAGSASSQAHLKATVPGDRLGWEADELNVVIELLETSDVTLDVYSPAFDPDDYRAALEGRTEVGDERYDGGLGTIESQFRLLRNGEIIVERSYGVSEHHTETLFSGSLPAGEYHLTSTFRGLGKNTFFYTLEADPAAQVFFDEGATMLFNVRGQELQPTLTVQVDPGDTPVTFEIYDGDGYEELRGRLDTPSGPLEVPMSGDLEWSLIRIGQAGTHTFSFYQPETAQQYSNTIGIRADARLLVTSDGVRVAREQPVQVRIIDTEGFDLPGEFRVDQEGHIRTANLIGLPNRYELIDTQTEGGVIVTPDSVRFGSAGGVVTFIADLKPAPPTTLTLSANLEYPGYSEPWPLDVQVDSETVRMRSGGVTLEVEPGLHLLTPEILPDGSVDGPSSVRVPSGGHADVHFVVTPSAQLSLSVDVHEREAGEQFVFTATASTQFPAEFPADLTLQLPAGLEPLDALSGSSFISPKLDYVLEVTAIGATPGSYDAVAYLAPWALEATQRVLVTTPPAPPAPVVQTPEPVTPPEETLEPEPEPEVPLPVPVTLPEFQLERASTVHLDFQAGEIVRCNLPALEAGGSTSRTLRVKLANPEDWTASELLPAVQPDGLTIPASSVEQDDADSDYARITVHVHNPETEDSTAGSLLIPLPAASSLDRSSVSSSDCQVTASVGDELQVSHQIPAGGLYVPGSALLDEQALGDPQATETENGSSLVWRFPYQREGTITYGVTHEEALGELHEPSLTVRLNTREDRLVGDSALLKPTPARPSAEGVEAGEPAEIIISATSLTADGRTPLEIDLFVVDAEGNATGDGFITISANAEPVTPDASSEISGHQIKLEEGYARLELEPALTAFELEVEALTLLDGIELTTSETLEVTGTRSGLYQAQVSVTARVTGGFDLRGVARGYVESPLGPGTLQAAADVSADLDGIDLDRSLANQPDPTDRYPLTGAGTEAGPSLRSSDGVAVLYTQPGVSVGYLHAPATVPGVSGLPTTTGLHGHLTAGTNLRVQGFAALLPEGRREAVIIPDGTRRYNIGESVARASETVTVIEGETERQLTRHVDYVIDEWLGAITLMQPLWPVTAQFEEVRLVVAYAPEDAARNQLAGGLGLQYRTEQLTVEAGAAWQEHLSTGASVKYRAERFEADARFGLEFQPDGTTHEGRASVSYNLTEYSKISAEHASSSGSNATSVRYRHQFNVGAQRSLSAGLGVKYAWEAASISALAEAGFKSGPLGVTLAHEQPFSSEARATTRAGVSYRLNQNLTARADLQSVWGNEFGGTLGLEQHIGDTQLSLGYELPTASGAGNRARFGVRSPFRLSDRLYLDLHAGLSRSFADSSTETAAGAAVRYRADTFTATLGAEVAHSEAGFKVVARSGLSGQLGVDQTIAVDANYQLSPSLEGRVSVAYALKRGSLNFLTYHRMLNSPERSLVEGEISPTFNLRQRLQLRPSVAYRVMFDDPDGNAYQASLFAIGYLSPELLGRTTTIGLGGGAHALWQPGTASVAYGASIEAQAMITREIWFGVGYTFAGFEGLTPETSGGLYLRLDLVSGAQF